MTSDAMVDAINEIAVVAEENAVSSEQMALNLKDQVEFAGYDQQPGTDIG